MTLAQRDLADFWEALDTTGDPTRVRDLLIEFFPDLLQSYGDTAAVLGADWYDMLRDVPPSASSFKAAMSPPVVAEQAAASARWGIGPLFQAEPKPAEALALLMGATQRLVLQPGRDTVWESAFADPVRTGVARLPSGTDTCAFCIMLASRGPIYQSEVSAELVVGRGSNRTGYDRNGRRLSGGIGGGVKARGKKPLGATFHDDCDCVSVVIRSASDYPDGYDPDAYLEMYRAGVGEGRYAPA